jgi:hypothetical protein
MKNSQSFEEWKKAESAKDKPPPVVKRPSFHSSHQKFKKGAKNGSRVR